MAVRAVSSSRTYVETHERRAASMASARRTLVIGGAAALALFLAGIVPAMQAAALSASPAAAPQET